MINLENKIERDKLIDDYFNKGYACDIREVYQAIVNTIADLEYANDEKDKEIERLNKCCCERTDCSGRINSKKYESVQEENERLHSIIKEAINYIDDNTYYKDHKGHINIDDLYLILQKGSESNE